MRTFLLAFFLFFVLLFAAGFGLIWAALDDDSLVDSQSHHQVEDADSVNALLSTIKNSFKRRKHVQNIAVDQSQLNSLMGLAKRARNDFNGEVLLSSQMARVQASYKFPDNPFGNYANFSAEVLPGEGLQLGQVKLGSLHVPGEWLVKLLAWGINWYTNSEVGSESLKQIDRVMLFDQSAIVVIQPLDDFLAQLEEVKDQISNDGNEPLRVRTAHYLKHLSELPETNLVTAQSLSVFIGKLFKEVESISQPDTAALENEAAIMALAIFAGNYRFAAFVGDVQPIDGEIARPNRPTTLAGRVDLSQHFLYSAAIKIMSEQGISAAIGEFKELMDRGDGGSGYSFVDLAADLAGIEFANQATNSISALAIQSALAGKLSESQFFPSISGLPEGLNKQQFEQRFTRVDSPKYKAMVNKIKQRIAALATYKN